VQDLADFVDNLKIEKFHLVGLSMGGATALGYALAHQKRLKSLTLASSGAAGYRVSRRFDRLNVVARQKSVEAALAEWKRWSLARYRNERQEIGRQIEKMMNGYSGSVWQDPMRGKYPEEEDLSRVKTIKTVTAIFAGTLDRVFVGLAKTLHERIENSQLAIYEKTGHMLNLEQPDRFNTDLRAFLDGVSQP
jgi:pimeloyl-ACP methyl ester carboxylesterase